MSGQHYRGLIVLFNLFLMLGIALLGFRAFRGSAPDPTELPPEGFQPLQYEIKGPSGPTSSIQEHRVSWQQLDREKPAPVPTNTQPTQIERPRVEDLSSLYTLLMANQNNSNQTKSTVILQSIRSPDKQLTLMVGDSFDGYEVKGIEVKGTSETREAVVTVETRGKEHRIQLKPRSQRMNRP